MIGEKQFWEEESKSPLLRLNKGFLTPENAKERIERARKWAAALGVTVASSEDRKKEDVSISWDEWSKQYRDSDKRIFVADADRTFVSDNYRKAFTRTLVRLESTFGDYAQGLGYVSSFLMLYLPEQTVYDMCVKLNDIMKGYWKHEAVGFATDARIFQKLLAEKLPEGSKYIDEKYIMPSTYCQKWFVGLCIHVLPYKNLFDFFDGFMERGVAELFRFGLSTINQVIVKMLKDKKIDYETPTHEVYALLRLDNPLVTEDVIKAIMAGMSDYDVKLDLEAVRKEVFTKEIEPRLKAATEARIKAEEEALAEEESDGEAGEECAICEENFPDMYCKSCEVLVCGMCHDGSKGEHSEDHPTTDDWSDIDLSKKMSKLTTNDK